MSNLTPERLHELRRIAETATPGPWIKDADNRYSVRSHWNPPRDGNVVGWRVCVVSGNGPQSDADWDYITEFNPKTALALLDRIEALEAENERLRQIEAAARTLVDTAFEVPGPDEHVYQAVRVDHFDTLATLLKMEGGDTHA